MSTPLELLSEALGRDGAERTLQLLRANNYAVVPCTPTPGMLEAAYWAAHEENALGVWQEMVSTSLGEKWKITGGQ